MGKISFPIDSMQQMAITIDNDTQYLNGVVSSFKSQIQNIIAELPGSMQGAFNNFFETFNTDMQQTLTLRHDIARMLTIAVIVAELTENNNQIGFQGQPEMYPYTRNSYQALKILL